MAAGSAKRATQVTLRARQIAMQIDLQAAAGTIRRHGASSLASASLARARRRRAADYPSQDIRLICAFPAGSGADVLVRYFAEKLRPIAGRTVIVENKAGAGGNIATEYVARAKPDGYTIYVHAGTAVAANQHLFKKPPVDVVQDIQVAATINRQPFMLVVDAKSPYKTVAELTAAMKKKGDKASYAYCGADRHASWARSTSNATGIKAVEVQLQARAPDSLNEMLSGKLDFGMHDPVFSLAQAARGPPAHSRGLDRQAPRGDAGHADHDGARHPDGPDRLVGRDGAGRHAEAGRRPDPQVVRADGVVGGHQEVPQQLRRRSVHQYAAKQGQAMLERDVKDWGDYVRLAKIEPM